MPMDMPSTSSPTCDHTNTLFRPYLTTQLTLVISSPTCNPSTLPTPLQSIPDTQITLVISPICDHTNTHYSLYLAQLTFGVGEEDVVSVKYVISSQ